MRKKTNSGNCHCATGWLIGLAERVTAIRQCNAQIHIYVLAYIHTYIHTYMYIYISTDIYIYTHIHIYIHTYILVE